MREFSLESVSNREILFFQRLSLRTYCVLGAVLVAKIWLGMRQVCALLLPDISGHPGLTLGCSNDLSPFLPQSPPL